MAKQEITQKDLLTITKEALQDWHDLNNEEAVRQSIFNKLNQSKDHILKQLLGFKKETWGNSWELDHCNGRQGNSIGGAYLKTVQDAAVKEWLSQVELPVLTKTDIASIQKSFKYAYMYAIEKGVEEHARRVAAADVGQMLEKLVTTPDINKYIETVNLLVSADK